MMKLFKTQFGTLKVGLILVSWNIWCWRSPPVATARLLQCSKRADQSCVHCESRLLAAVNERMKSFSQIC